MRRVFGVLALLVAACWVVPASAGAAGESTVTADPAATWQTNGVVWALAYANGVVYAGGTFTAVRPSGVAAGGSGEIVRTNFAAFDAATGQPLPCAPAFTLASGAATVRALKASPDGSRVYVGGYFGSAAGALVSNLVALDTAACTLSSFRPAVDATVRALDVTPSTVYLGGDFGRVVGQPRSRAAALTPAGALTPFAPAADAPVRAVAAAPAAARVFLGGDFENLGSGPAHRLAAVDAASGATVQTFPGWLDPGSTVKALAVDGGNVYVGAEGTGGGVFDGRIAATVGGTLLWRDTCLGATQAVLPYNGVLYSGSHAHNCVDTPGGFPDNNVGGRQHLLAQSISDRGTILPWFPDTNDGIGEGIGPRALVMAGGTLWVAGEFSTVNDAAQQGLTRFPAGPDVGPPTPPVPSVVSYQPGVVQVRWRTAWDRDDGVLTYRLYRDAGSTPIYTASADSRFWNRPQLSYPDTVPAGSFHTYRLDVSDGDNTSVRGGTAGQTAASAASPYPARVLADAPSLYWRLDEAAAPFAADSSARNASGVYQGTLSYRATGGISGDADTAVSTAGDGYAYSNERVPSPTTFSVELWFRTTSTTGGRLIGFGNAQLTNSTSYDRHIYLNNAGQLLFGEYDGAVRVIKSPATYNNGAWHHAVATAGPVGMHLYVDGGQVAGSASTSAQVYDGYWRVGSDSVGGSWPERPTTTSFSGSVDEVAVYPVQLSATQVAAHAAAGGLRTSPRLPVYTPPRIPIPTSGG